MEFMYFQALFESIDPEVLSNQVMKYHKTVIQLEKGLPPNAVVPQLRSKVDKMRHKVTHEFFHVLKLEIYLCFTSFVVKLKMP